MLYCCLQRYDSSKAGNLKPQMVGFLRVIVDGLDICSVQKEVFFGNLKRPTNENDCIGVNISERKSGPERTKKA